MTLDYLFGRGVSEGLPLGSFAYVTSRRTGKLRSVSWNGRLLATIRSDGGVALTVFCAEMLCASKSFDGNCATVAEEAVGSVSSGLSVFAKHVVRCGSNIRPRSEVVVLSPKGKVVAVGKAVLSARDMMSFERGVAVKVREGAGSGLDSESVSAGGPVKSKRLKGERR
ncbi:MAG: queuine tRNA-ribosyltransferase [Thaumarchaeota archaeon]|nr:queuine tRNA-ribosyltransferase [Nitrososphaerota archaeon]